MAKAFTFIVILCGSMQPAGNCPSNLTGEMVKRLITYIKCAGGLTCCNGVCRLLYVDPANCGACGRVCPTGAICSGGNCVCLANNNQPTCGNLCCAAGQSCCNGVCTTLTTTTNCGACGTTCPAGQGCCNGACTALNTATNCGACGRAPLVYHLAMVFVALSKTSPAAVDNAPAFQALLRAVGHVAMPRRLNDVFLKCAGPNDECCGGICTPGDTTTDCGACGNACGVNEECCLGVCTAVDTPAACGDCTTVCNTDDGCCAGVCTPLTTITDCGCLGGSTCTDGDCVCPGTNLPPCGTNCCTDGTLACCADTCTDLLTDPNNCGGCGTVLMSSVWLEVWPGIRIGNAWYLCSSGNFVILGLYGGESVIQHRWPKFGISITILLE
ncbi:putative extracellular cysteine-rich protein [Aspergillus fumigatus]